MKILWRRWRPFFFGLLLSLWFVQLGWLAWHYASETLALGRRLLGDQTSTVSRPADAWDGRLTELAELIPPSATYILVDCYDTGNYARMRYVLHPRRQVRLDPKTTPALLFTEIKLEGATFLILGGCNLEPQWQFLFQGGHPLFQVESASGVGLVFRIDLAKLTGGFYD